MEAEIQRIEQSIIDSEQQTKALRDEQRSINNKCGSIVHQNSLKFQCSDNRNAAERNRNKLQSLEGITSWIVTEHRGSSISTEVKDRNFPEFCILIDFREVSTTEACGNIMCKVKFVRKNTTSSLNKRGKYNDTKKKYSSYSLNTMGYIEHYAREMCKELNRQILRSSSDICKVVNHVEWNFGRLAIVAKELTMLERRHKGVLRRRHDENETASYVLDVNFKTQRDQTISASFQICEAYPFAELDVDLSLIGDTDIDIDVLERQLIKSSKPGFGYLTRSCDVISCFDC